MTENFNRMNGKSTTIGLRLFQRFLGTFKQLRCARRMIGEQCRADRRSYFADLYFVAKRCFNLIPTCAI